MGKIAHFETLFKAAGLNLLMLEEEGQKIRFFFKKGNELIKLPFESIKRLIIFI